MAQGKKYSDATKRYDREHAHSSAEGIAVCKTLATKNFDESIDVSIRLGVDPRKADQMLRGTVALPSGTGKDVRVAVFAAGDSAPRTSPPASRVDSSTSMSPSPHQI